MTKDEALMKALGALYDEYSVDKAISAIKAALAQPEHDLIRRMQGQIERLQAALDTLPDRGLSAMAAIESQPPQHQPVILVTEIHLTPEQRESLRCKTDVAIPEFALPAQQDAETNLQAVSDFGQLQAQPDERDRCTHGVWIADHCYKCAASQPAQEPVAMKTHGAWDGLDLLDGLPDGTELYTSPHQRQPLTDDEIKAIQYSDPVFMTCSCPAFARAIEAAHNIGDKT